MTGVAISETAFQQAVTDLADLRGWLWFHDVDSRRNNAGFLDLVLLHPRTGQLLFAELKTAKGRVSREQQTWIDGLRRGGHVVHVWRPAHFVTGQIQSALTPSDVARTA